MPRSAQLPFTSSKSKSATPWPRDQSLQRSIGKSSRNEEINDASLIDYDLHPGAGHERRRQRRVALGLTGGGHSARRARAEHHADDENDERLYATGLVPSQNAGRRRPRRATRPR